MSPADVVADQAAESPPSDATSGELSASKKEGQSPALKPDTPAAPAEAPLALSPPRRKTVKDRALLMAEPRSPVPVRGSRYGRSWTVFAPSGRCAGGVGIGRARYDQGGDCHTRWHDNLSIGGNHSGSGKTIEQLRKEIAKALEEFYVAPRVSVISKKVHKRLGPDVHATIIGPIGRPVNIS